MLRNEKNPARRSFDASGPLKPSWDVKNPAGKPAQLDTDVPQPSSIDMHIRTMSSDGVWGQDEMMCRRPPSGID